jgi:predicted O-methyltransferase YrrM
VTFNEIPGWFDFHDIYRQAVREAADGDVFVEVGTWLGKSAAFMAQAIKDSGKSIKFYCVDTFKGTEGVVGTYDVANVYEKWLANMQACEVAEHVRPLRMTSEQASRIPEDKSLAFVFIDADHSYEAVCNDIRCWLPKVKPGGVIAGHDFHEEDVNRAVTDSLPQAVARPPASWWHRVAPEA